MSKETDELSKFQTMMGDSFELQTKARGFNRLIRENYHSDKLLRSMRNITYQCYHCHSLNTKIYHSPKIDHRNLVMYNCKECNTLFGEGDTQYCYNIETLTENR